MIPNALADCGDSVRQAARQAEPAMCGRCAGDARAMCESATGAANSLMDLSLLLNKSICSPHALSIAIRGIYKLDIMADYANYAETSVFRCRQTLKPREEFLHFLMLAGLSMLIGGIEFILRQTSVRIRQKTECLLWLNILVLSLARDCGE
jgi:hypothetical protein